MEETSNLAELMAEARERVRQLRAEGRVEEARRVETLANRWEPIARGELFPYGGTC